MASPQFNLRLRDGLDQQVRRFAAQHGVEPRVVVEDALIGHFHFRREGPGVDPGQLALPVAADGAATVTEPAGSAGGPVPAGPQRESTEETR